MVKLKLVFFAENLIRGYDGAVRTMYQLIDRIDSDRFEFLFICGEGPESINCFECVHVPAITLPVNSNYKMSIPQLAFYKLQKKLKAFSPDIIHIATPSLLGQFAIKFAVANGLPAVSIYHTHFVSYIDYYLRKLPFLISPVKANMQAGQRVFYNNCHTLYVPSVSMANELLATGVDDFRLKIWQRGVDTQLFNPCKKDLSALPAITGNHQPNILFASRLVWEKNLETLIAVYDALQESETACNLIIAGDGVAMQACKKRMPHAFFTGKQSHDELAVLYASADIFLFPSVSETYGNVVLEAMASGLPCVIANGGGSKDFIQQGINGFTCSPFDASDYVAKIAALLKDHLLRQRIAAKGRAFSLQFDWQTLANIYFDDIEEIALTGIEKTAPAA